MSTLELTSKQRSALRSAAHPLKPVVLIGDQGLTPAVLKEIDLALTSHELIKVKAGGQEREDRSAILTQICEQLDCAPVHHLGKTLIVYRPGKRDAFAEQLGHKPTTAAKPTALVKRRASDPHTPKKLAAQGKTLGKRNRPSEIEVADKATGDQTGRRVFSAEKPDRSTQSTTRPDRRAPARKAVGQTVAKRATRATPRSALSLRAGARRGKR